MTGGGDPRKRPGALNVKKWFSVSYAVNRKHLGLTQEKSDFNSNCCFLQTTSNTCIDLPWAAAPQMTTRCLYVFSIFSRFQLIELQKHLRTIALDPSKTVETNKTLANKPEGKREPDGK